MDSTLAQILSHLFALAAQVNELKAKLAEADQKILDLQAK